MIKCKWCKTILKTTGDPGFYWCACQTIAIDRSLTHYRVIANFDDIEEMDF